MDRDLDHQVDVLNNLKFRIGIVLESANFILKKYALVSKYSKNSWFKFLDHCQILLKVNFIKTDYLLSILNQIDQ